DNALLARRNRIRLSTDFSSDLPCWLDITHCSEPKISFLRRRQSRAVQLLAPPFNSTHFASRLDSKCDRCLRINSLIVQPHAANNSSAPRSIALKIEYSPREAPIW